MQQNNKLYVLLAFASVYIIWGSTFLAISYGLKGFPPFLLSGLRFSIAGLLLFAWRYARGERNMNALAWGRNAITGLLILTGGTGLVMWGEQYVSSAEAAIAIATGPFWFIVIDRGNWRQYFNSKAVVGGLAIGFIGLLLFLKGSVHSPHSAGPSMRIIAFAVLAASSVAWVLGSLYSRNKPAGHSTVMNSAQQLLAAGAGGFLVALFRGEWTGFRLTGIPAPAWGGLAFLVLFGSVIAYLSYIWLLSVRNPVMVSTHTYINPIVAVIAGWLLAGEQISGIQFTALGVILSGVLLTNLSAYRFLWSKRTRVRLRRAGSAFSRFVQPYKYSTH